MEQRLSWGTAAEPRAARITYSFRVKKGIKQRKLKFKKGGGGRGAENGGAPRRSKSSKKMPMPRDYLYNNKRNVDSKRGSVTQLKGELSDLKKGLVPPFKPRKVGNTSAPKLNSRGAGVAKIKRRSGLHPRKRARAPGKKAKKPVERAFCGSKDPRPRRKRQNQLPRQTWKPPATQSKKKRPEQNERSISYFTQVNERTTSYIKAVHFHRKRAKTGDKSALLRDPKKKISLKNQRQTVLKADCAEKFSFPIRG